MGLLIHQWDQWLWIEVYCPLSLAILQVSNNEDIIIVVRKGDSAHRCHAVIELVIGGIPNRWLVASALNFCSIVTSISVEEKDFVILLTSNHQLLKSWKLQKAYEEILLMHRHTLQVIVHSLHDSMWKRGY